VIGFEFGPQVPLGSVTPLVIANPEAEAVILLLDRNILPEARVFVHPLVNTVSLSMSPDALTAALKYAFYFFCYLYAVTLLLVLNVVSLWM
jgi:hypothetical protein